MSSAASAPGTPPTPVEQLDAEQRARYDALHDRLEELLEADKLRKWEKAARGELDHAGAIEDGEDLVDAMDTIDGILEAIERPRYGPSEKELLDEPTRYKNSVLPTHNRLPGFDEPGEDCGRFLVESTYFCPDHGTTYPKPHNCGEYQCPDHWAHGVRNRAAGTSSMPGLIAWIVALQTRLQHSPEYGNVVNHHWFISPPPHITFEAADPLEKFKEVCREIADVVEFQGLHGYHSHRTEEEGIYHDSRGEWKKILGSDLTWGQALERLVEGQHMHLLGPAEEGAIPGPAVTIAVEALTKTGDGPGWIIGGIDHYYNGPEYDEPANKRLASAGTYVLSHCPLYETEEQHRLAAWMKGPDVNSTKVFERHKKEHIHNVLEVSKEVLGIHPPNMDCDCDEPDEPEPPRSSTGGDDRWSFSAARSSGAVTSGGGPHGLDVTYGADDEDGDDRRSGTRLRHISQAGEHLPELRDRGVDVKELDAQYRKYVDAMTDREIDEHGLFSVPEFEDRPPPLTRYF